ncbi:MAG: DNA translocase FtsK [Balneolales bacterium]|nr:DNA translocase FtsK [Balneolales bacterium]
MPKKTSQTTTGSARSSQSTAAAPFLTQERKLEILGVIMICVALLISISVFTYHPSDNSIVQSVSLGELASQSSGASARIQNGLGPLGAFISYYLVFSLLGYTSIVLPGLLLIYGWYVFRHHSVSHLHRQAIYYVSVMVLAATILAWFGILTGMPSPSWSGTIGGFLASALYGLMAAWGSGIILASLTIISLLFLVDRDIQKTIDRMKGWVSQLQDRFAQNRKNASEARKQQEEEDRLAREDEAAQMRAQETEERQNADKKPSDKSYATASATAVSGASSINSAEEDEDIPFEIKRTPKDERLEQRPEDPAEHTYETQPAVSETTDETTDVAEAPETVKTPEVLPLAPRADSEEEITPPVKEESSEERQLRLQREEREQVSSRLPRALLEKDKSAAKEEKSTATDKAASPDDEDDIDFHVYKGEGEEKAGERDLRKARKSDVKPVIKFRFPGYDLLDEPPTEGNEIDMEEIQGNKRLITNKLKLHGITILNINAIIGPTVTLYELQPAPDVKISKIEGYANDLKMAMATHGLRIIAPIPGKSAVGIEVPNRKKEIVYIKDVIATKKFADSDMTLPVAFGKTIENEVFMLDLNKLPHVLVAGATGSGKSVGINTIITCLLYKVHPDNLKFVLIDPKKIELALYRNIQNHYLATMPGIDEPIITDTSVVQEVLNSVCLEMDNRYDLLKMAMVRDIKAYNDKFKAGSLEDDLGHKHLPYIVVIIDELADLMITAGKGIEEPIARIAQLARAVGIHLVVATQRPSVNVITGTIKANFPARIAYRVASKVDSRTILDTMGADQLVGKGDMLYTGGAGMVRVQNAFVSTEEVERINAFIGAQQGYSSPYMLPKLEDENSNQPDILDKSERDDLFEDAARTVVLHQQGSVSLLQRKLKLGYNRAGRIIDQLFAAGVVGPYQGSTARDVLIQDEIELEELFRELDQ